MSYLKIQASGVSYTKEKGVRISLNIVELKGVLRFYLDQYLEFVTCKNNKINFMKIKYTSFKSNKLLQIKKHKKEKWCNW